MEKNEVIDAIKILRKYNTETNRIEAKSALLGFPKKCYDTISSFSNKYGGIIIFGLNEDDNFKTEGVYDINDLQKQITSLCSDAMVPRVRTDILPLEFEGKNILAVKIEELRQNKKPCYYKPKGLKAGSYTREGDRDELLTDYEIYAFESYNDHIFEDTRPTKKSSIEDLNKESLKEYLNKIKELKPNFSKNSYEKNLKLCGIVDSDNNKIYPTLAGTLIFGDYPQSFYPQLFVACSVIPGTKLGDVGSLGERFIDNQRVEGTIEEMLDGTMRFLRRNMKTRVIIDSNGKRENRTEYPLEALREAVANALIHRDYSKETESAFISVYMYEDRVEILNPGALYGANKIEKLGTDTIMESRNPTIVRILEEKGSVIENRHTGIPTMKREMEKYELPEPEFYEERGSFKVIFRNSMNFELDSISEQVGGQQNIINTIYNMESDTESDTQSDTESDTQSDTESEVFNNVLAFCKEPKTAKEIRNYLGISSKRYVAYKILKPLIDLNKLEYTNKKITNARNQRYVTVRDNKK